MKKKLSLGTLKVQSFVTSHGNQNSQTIKGGNRSDEPIIIIHTEQRFTACIICTFTDNDKTCGHYYCPIDSKGIGDVG